MPTAVLLVGDQLLPITSCPLSLRHRCDAGAVKKTLAPPKAARREPVAGLWC